MRLSDFEKYKVKDKVEITKQQQAESLHTKAIIKVQTEL